MHCMKCGREISDQQVFCDGCLAVMSRYPVKSGITITLPDRQAPEAAKKPTKKKKELSDQELLLFLQKRLQRVMLLAVVLALATSVLSVMLFHALDDTPAPVLGRNYTVDSTQTP